MKNLFKSVSCGNPAKFVWQQAAPTAAQEWVEANEASKEANEASSQAVDAMLNAASKRYEQGMEFAEAVGASVSEESDKLGAAIQAKVDSAKASMWSFAVKIYGKTVAAKEAVQTVYNSAMDKVDEVATAGVNAAKDAYISTIEGIEKTAKVIAGAGIMAGKAFIDANKYVYKKGKEGVKAGYDATVDAGEYIYDEASDVVQTVGDFGRGVGMAIEGATERGRNARLARNEVKNPVNENPVEETEYASENISSLPKNMQNFGNNIGEMVKNIPYKTRKSFVIKNNIVSNYGGTGKQNQILFNYLEKNK